MLKSRIKLTSSYYYQEYHISKTRADIGLIENVITNLLMSGGYPTRDYIMKYPKQIQ